MSLTSTATKFVPRESYMHKYAKEVLKEWLETRQIGEIGTNASSQYHIEYPIVKTGNDGSNHTSWDNDIFEWYMGEDWPYGNPVQMSYQDCVKEFRCHPVAIVDLVVMRKGHPYQAIEICHTNPVSDEKIEVLQEFGVRKLYEIDAEWIMRQTGVPKEIKYRRLI